MDLQKIEPDFEKAKSLIKLAQLRQSKLHLYCTQTEYVLIVEAYYEIIKEITTVLLFVDGYKTLSHKDLFEYLTIHYSHDFSDQLLSKMDFLRKRRNKIVYFGRDVPPNYLERNETYFVKCIDILDKNLNMKLYK